MPATFIYTRHSREIYMSKALSVTNNIPKKKVLRNDFFFKMLYQLTIRARRQGHHDPATCATAIAIRRLGSAYACAARIEEAARHGGVAAAEDTGVNTQTDVSVEIET